MHTLGIVMPGELGARMRELRKRAGISPEQAGIETGLSARVIGDFERGYRIPRIAYLRVLAALYGVPITELVTAVTPEELRDWVTASRAEQGLPPTVEDPGVLERAAAAFRVMASPSDEPTVSTPRKRRRKPPTIDQKGTAA